MADGVADAQGEINIPPVKSGLARIDVMG